MTRFPTTMVFVHPETGALLSARLDLVDGRVVQVGEIEDAPARFDGIRQRLEQERGQRAAAENGEEQRRGPGPRDPRRCSICRKVRPGGMCERARTCAGCPTRAARAAGLVRQREQQGASGGA